MIGLALRKPVRQVEGLYLEFVRKVNDARSRTIILQFPR